MNMSRPLRNCLVMALAATLPLFANATPNDIGTKITGPGEAGVSQQVTLGLSKSLIVDLESPAADVVITNPAIADAVVQTAYSVGEFMLHRDETGYYIEEVFQSGGFDYGTLMDTMKTVKEKTLFGSKKNANSPRIYVRLPGLELRRAPGRWRAGQPMPHTNDNRPPPGTPLPPSPPRRATGVPIMDDAGEE